MKRIFCVLFALALATGAWAVTYNTPSLVDAGISIGASDWDADELCVDDSNSDSPWGVGNEVDNVYVTWDATNLYLGADIAATGNAAIIWVDLGVSGGENNFLAYGGAYPRNVNWTSIDIDLLVGGWDNASGGGFGVWSIVDNGSTDISGSVTIQGGTSFVEVGADWNVLYGLGAGTVPTNAVISVVSGVAGGDDYGTCDSAPDNADSDGDAGPDVLDNVWTFPLDQDGNGVPDSGVTIPVELSVFSAN